jgi:hypothetical protein
MSKMETEESISLQELQATITPTEFDPTLAPEISVLETTDVSHPMSLAHDLTYSDLFGQTTEIWAEPQPSSQSSRNFWTPQFRRYFIIVCCLIVIASAMTPVALLAAGVFNAKNSNVNVVTKTETAPAMCQTQTRTMTVMSNGTEVVTSLGPNWTSWRLSDGGGASFTLQHTIHTTASISSMQTPTLSMEMPKPSLPTPVSAPASLPIPIINADHLCQTQSASKIPECNPGRFIFSVD